MSERERRARPPHPGFAQAEQLVLTPKARRALADAGQGGADGPQSDQAGL